MSNDIRVRLWNPERNVMTGGNDLVTIVMTTDKEFSDSFFLNKMIWLQYTGLKDKNKKEIYEGDIVSGIESGYENMVINGWRGERIGEVAMDKALGCWCYKLKGQTHQMLCYLKDCVVIGNIYQNPELLKDL